MNVTPTHASQIQAPSQSLCELVKKNFKQKEKWGFLVPTIVTLVAGLLFLPNTAIGVATGFVTLASQITVGEAFLGERHFREHPRIIYSETDHFFNNYFEPLTTTLMAPIGEELAFRGILQPLLSRTIEWLIPSASESLCGMNFSKGVAASIFMTSVAFGLSHIPRGHKGQATPATVSGFVLGILRRQYGLSVSISAHITQNTLVCSMIKLLENEKTIFRPIV